MAGKKKLTDAAVGLIKAALQAPHPPTLASLAQGYGVDPTTIARIRDGKLRKNVPATVVGGL